VLHADDVAPLTRRSRAPGTDTRQWRLHLGALIAGALVGVAVTLWDLSHPTVCSGPIRCIDYTGVALVTYWVVFLAQAALSTLAMSFVRRARGRMFASHIVSAAGVSALLVVGLLVLFSRIP
jgi:hypothetical protein